MDSLESYYAQRVSQSDDLLYQVGKTVNGDPISAAQFDLIVEAISRGLALSLEDSLVDFGCGNGVLTNVIAPQVKMITGVERNQALFERACQYVSHHNTSLVQADVLCMGLCVPAYNKAYSYEVVQHFSHAELAGFVSRVMKELPKGGCLFLGGIPDERRKWSFYSDEKRRFQLAEALLNTGCDPIGTWFFPEFFYVLADRLSLCCEVLEQHADLYTAHYRFDCVFRG